MISCYNVSILLAKWSLITIAENFFLYGRSKIYL
jgi:hypothetical protein